MKNLDKKVVKYYKKFDKKLVTAAPSETVFRLLGNNNFSFKSKNILDVGIGYGDNLLEFKRRGGKIFGIDIRKKVLKLFIKKNNLNSKNFFSSDLNKNFPKINKKMDLVLCKDTIYYLKPRSQFILFDKVDEILKKGGYFLFQYIQCQLKQNYNKNFFSFNLNKKSDFRSLEKYSDSKNPINFLTKNHIKKLLKHKKFKIKSNTFDISTHIKNRKIIISINRFILLQK